jgi:hypothetical protein
VHALADDAQDVEDLPLVMSLLFIRMPMAVPMSRLPSSAIRRFWSSSWSMNSRCDVMLMTSVRSAARQPNTGQRGSVAKSSERNTWCPTKASRHGPS